MVILVSKCYIINKKNNEVRHMEIKIRPWRMEDAPDIAPQINNKNVLDNLRDGIPYPYNEEHAKAFIYSMITADKNSVYAWAITADDKAIGSIGVFRKDNIHIQTAEMGYYIGESYWGKGIGIKAVRDACSFIFTNTDIIRIFAEPFAYNTASCRILEKAGFTYEGTMTKNAVKNGRVLDMRLYALVKDQD
jgi:RimJ/RimL family protein N-acetyltransferase